MILKRWPRPFNVDLISALAFAGFGAAIAIDCTNYTDATAYDFLDAVPPWLFSLLLILTGIAQATVTLRGDLWARRAIGTGGAIFWVGMAHGSHMHDPHTYVWAFHLVFMVANLLTLIGA